MYIFVTSHLEFRSLLQILCILQYCLATPTKDQSSIVLDAVQRSDKKTVSSQRVHNPRVGQDVTDGGNRQTEWGVVWWDEVTIKQSGAGRQKSISLKNCILDYNLWGTDTFFSFVATVHSTMRPWPLLSYLCNAAMHITTTTVSTKGN